MSNIIDNKKIFHINSRNRISGTDNNFNISLEIDKDDEFDNVVVLSCNIPKSYYMVQEGYNTFILKETGQPNKTITIPAGNYNRRSFQYTLQSVLLNIAGYEFIVDYSHPNSVDSGKFKYSFSALNHLGVAFQFLNNNLSEIMGFNRNTTYNFNNSVLYSSNVLKFQLEDVLYIRSDIVDNSGVNNNILLEIYCSNNEKTFGNINYNVLDLEAMSRPMNTQHSNVFNFWLTNEDDEPIFLNGLNINLSIMCYKKNNISQLIKGFIKYLTLKD